MLFGVEVLIFLGGFCFIIFYFVKNTYFHGVGFAKTRSNLHFVGVKIFIQAFVDVFIKGKTEKEIMVNDH